MSDLVCKACGGKLYDSKRNLRYWYNSVVSDETGGFVPHRYGCIRCGYLYSLADKREWSAAACDAKVDVPVFDAQSEARGLCPPTVFRRFRARLDELRASDREVQDAQELLETIWGEWRTEQEA